MTTTWMNLFKPIVDSSTKKMDPRPQQALLGQAIIDTFESKGNLVAQALVGTGKSFAALVPMINEILDSKKTPTPKRGAISTENLSLQDQYFLTDLPFLAKTYPGFTYKTLKGRTNYICFDVAKQNARGNTTVAGIVSTLDRQRGRLGLGERRDVERLLKKELNDHTWSFIAGSSIHCGENQCSTEECYSTRARAEALKADIVIINHALLRVDAETRDSAVDETFLGPIDYLVVDEAHTLEKVLIDGWTEELDEWELLSKSAKISEAVDLGTQYISDASLGYLTQNANDGVADFLKSITRFFGLIHKDEDWKNVTDTISQKFITGGTTQQMISAMTAYEVDGLKDIESAIKTYERTEKFLKRVKDKMADEGIKGTRKISKGLTASKDMIKVLTKIKDAMDTKGGTIVEFGVPYVVTASGIERRNGELSVRLRVVPLDISSRAKDIWRARSTVLMSGTLVDLTDGSFKYAATSLGFEDYTQIATDSVFDQATQQLVYVTPGLQERIDVKGAQFSMIELIDLITAARGRSLVLFTSRAELDYAASQVRQMVAEGTFPWRVLVQDKDANKTNLKEEFEKDVHSVLFATKSFFTGNDFPGETVSLVAIVKFPLPQFNVVCRQQMDWWRRRGFPNWYEREALAVFHQASGRLIRSSGDVGVLALLDQRASRADERVFKTALMGVEGLGSPVTQNIEQVKSFLV